MTREEAVNIVSEYFDKVVMSPDETEAFQVLLSSLNGAGSL